MRPLQHPIYAQAEAFRGLIGLGAPSFALYKMYQGGSDGVIRAP